MGLFDLCYGHMYMYVCYSGKYIGQNIGALLLGFLKRGKRAKDWTMGSGKSFRQLNPVHEKGHFMYLHYE